MGLRFSLEMRANSCGYLFRRVNIFERDRHAIELISNLWRSPAPYIAEGVAMRLDAIKVAMQTAEKQVTEALTKIA